MPPPFFIRYKRVVWSTFTIVFILCLLVTLFTAPTYQATALVGFRKGSNPRQEVARLMSPQLLNTLRPSTQSTEAAPPPHVRVVPASNGEMAALVVEAGNPKYAADCANQWAKTYANSHGDPNRVEPASVPQAPFRPKKAQNMIVGAILGLVLGLVFAFFREIFGEMADAAARRKKRGSTP